MKKINFMELLFLITSLLIVIASLILPESNLLYCILGALFIAVLAVFDIKMPAVAKLSNNNPKVKTMRFLNRICIFIFTIISIFALFSPLQDLFSPKTRDILLIGIVSLFLMIFGNLSPKIPCNRYFGFRLPWTIRDEDTWKVAHKFLGYLSFPVAIAMFVLSFFFDINIIAPIFILILILVPGIYSLLFYIKKRKRMDI